MKRTLIYTIISLLAICACENETYVDHSFQGTINQTTNPDAPSISEAVDLGLSVKWAPYNIGAKQAHEYGNYYAYGETSTKDSYSQQNYTAPANENTFGNIISTDSDVATKTWGQSWRMPSAEEINELKNCIWKETEINGVKGLKITSRTNGNSIFLPAAGIYTDNKLFEHNNKGFYRSGDNRSTDFEYFNNPDGDYYGFSIRPVLSIAGEQTNEIKVPQDSEAIDLGLSVKWAPYNVGATDASEYGNYYSFGEIEPKTNYTRENYIEPTEFNCEGGIENSNSDVATVKWGKQWRIPSGSEIDELFGRCYVTEKKYDGILGYEFTGPNGNTMFLPFSGYMDDYKPSEKGMKSTYYWNSDNYIEEYNNYRGLPVRPVLIEPLKQAKDFPVPTPEESVDLDLSVNWAPYNVGASSETETGNYYAWGETEFKDSYCEHNHTSPTELNSKGGISGTKHDVAHVKWGNGWRMPTEEEISELWLNCTWKEETRNGVDGIAITSYNGNSIFLPVTGMYDHSGLKNTENGYYRNDKYSETGLNYFNIDNKFLGAVVRPVIENGNNDANEDTSTENLIKVSFDNITHTNYTKNHWSGKYTDRIDIGADFTISISNKNTNVKEYGIYLYRNGARFAQIPSKNNVGYSFDLLAINFGSAKSASAMANPNNMQENDNYDENTLNIKFAACQDDFAYMFNNGTYIANLGGSYKYSTYYITEDGLEYRGEKLYPINIEYRLEDTPYVIIGNIHENGPVEDHGSYMQLPYGWEMTTHGGLFIDTLYSVYVTCTFTNINDPASYTVTNISKSGSETIYEGKIGVGTSYTFSRNDNDYEFRYFEGAIRKGNELVKIRTRPMVFKRSNGNCTLSSPDIEGWPEKFTF